jgi:hypothetical protein
MTKWPQIAVLIAAFGSMALGQSDKAQAEFRSIHRGDSKTLVLFVHGLWSDPATAFKADQSNRSWPDMMANDREEVRGQAPLSRYAIGTLGYPATRSNRLTIPQIATQLLTELTDTGVFEKYDNIIFVTHSMGGLVVKQMLLDASTPLHPPLRERTRVVFLISTPSKGAPAVDFVKALPKIALGPLVFDLKPISENTYLQDLDKQWDNFLRARRGSVNLRIYCAYETLPTSGITVVPEQYTSTLCDQTPFPVDADHIQIVKPNSEQAAIYTWVRGRIAEISMSMKQDTASTSEQQKGSTELDKQPPQQPPPLPQRAGIEVLLADYLINQYLRDREQFTDFVDYYGKGSISRKLALEDKRRYATLWPVRLYDLIPGSLRILQSSPNLIIISFSFTFTVSNSSKKARGTGTVQVTLVPHGQTFLVSGVKELSRVNKELSRVN